MRKTIQINIPKLIEDDVFICGGLYINSLHNTFTAYMICSEYSYDYKDNNNNITLMRIIPLGEHKYDKDLEAKWKSNRVFWNDILEEEIEKYFQVYSAQDILDSEEGSYHTISNKGHYIPDKLMSEMQKVLYNYIEGVNNK